MGEYISRQAAIDALARTARDAFNLSDEYNNYLAGLMDGENAIRDLPSAQQEQQWIPVSERSPEKGQTCLVCDEGVIAIDKYLGIGNPLNWDWYDRDYEAWMPLPKPYKGDEKC